MRKEQEDKLLQLTKVHNLNLNVKFNIFAYTGGLVNLNLKLQNSKSMQDFKKGIFKNDEQK